MDLGSTGATIISSLLIPLISGVNWANAQGSKPVFESSMSLNRDMNTEILTN